MSGSSKEINASPAEIPHAGDIAGEIVGEIVAAEPTEIVSYLILKSANGAHLQSESRA